MMLAVQNLFNVKKSKALTFTTSNPVKISDHLLHILRPRHGYLPTGLLLPLLNFPNLK